MSVDYDIYLDVDFDSFDLPDHVSSASPARKAPITTIAGAKPSSEPPKAIPAHVVATGHPQRSRMPHTLMNASAIETMMASVSVRRSYTRSAIRVDRETHSATAPQTYQAAMAPYATSIDRAVAKAKRILRPVRSNIPFASVRPAKANSSPGNRGHSLDTGSKIPDAPEDAFPEEANRLPESQ